MKIGIYYFLIILLDKNFEVGSKYLEDQNCISFVLGFWANLTRSVRILMKKGGKSECEVSVLTKPANPTLLSTVGFPSPNIPLYTTLTQPGRVRGRGIQTLKENYGFLFILSTLPLFLSIIIRQLRSL